MIGNVTIRPSGDWVSIKAPKNELWRVKARQLGGEWDSPEMVWTFRSHILDAIRAALIDIYGTDGTVETRLTADLYLKSGGVRDGWKHGYGLRLSGYDLVENGSRAINGASIIAGSVKVERGPPWIEAGTVIRVAGLAPADLTRLPTYVERYDVLEADPTIALKVERAGLLTRLAEIDALLTDAA